MFSLLHMMKFGSKRSHSAWVDFQQVHVRNLLLFCFGLSISRQLFMENINCQVTGNELQKSFADTACFINGTMTPGDPTVFHDYYQWVSIYLLGLAFCMHFPLSVWFAAFGGYLDEIRTRCEEAKEPVCPMIRDSQGCRLFWKTWALEWIYCLHLLVQGWVANVFFNRQWSQWGWSWTAIPVLFPDEGVCHLEYFTAGGSTAGKIRCLLPLGTVYRKIFFALYVTAVLLLTMGVLVLCYRTALLARRGKLINVWWAMTIAERETKTWADKRLINNYWKKIEKHAKKVQILPDFSDATQNTIQL